MSDSAEAVKPDGDDPSTDDIQQISETLAAGGQPDAAKIQQLAAKGFKSIVNLRSPHESGVLSDEQKQAEAAGLEYVNVPLSPNQGDNDLTAKVLWELEDLPTPVFFHCGAGARAGALALIALATQQGLNRKQVIAKAQELSANLNQPHLKGFLESLE